MSDKNLDNQQAFEHEVNELAIPALDTFFKTNFENCSDYEVKVSDISIAYVKGISDWKSGSANKLSNVRVTLELKEQQETLGERSLDEVFGTLEIREGLGLETQMKLRIAKQLSDDLKNFLFQTEDLQGVYTVEDILKILDGNSPLRTDHLEFYFGESRRVTSETLNKLLLPEPIYTLDFDIVCKRLKSAEHANKELAMYKRFVEIGIGTLSALDLTIVDDSFSFMFTHRNKALRLMAEFEPIFTKYFEKFIPTLFDDLAIMLGNRIIHGDLHLRNIGLSFTQENLAVIFDLTRASSFQKLDPAIIERILFDINFFWDSFNIRLQQVPPLNLPNKITLNRSIDKYLRDLDKAFESDPLYDTNLRPRLYAIFNR